MGRLRSFMAVLWGLTLAWAPLATLHAEEPSLAATMPAGAIAYLEINKLASLIDTITGSEYWQQLEQSPGWQVAKLSPQYKRYEAGRRIVENQIGTDAVTAGKKLFGKQIAGAVYPKEGGDPDAVFLIRVADQELLTQIKQRLEAFLQLFMPNALTEAEMVNSVRAVTVQSRLHYFVREDVVAIASTKDLLLTTARLMEGMEESALGDRPDFAKLMADSGGDAIVRGYIDAKSIIAATKIADQPRKMDNALASLLFAGIAELAVHTDSVGIDISNRPSGMDLRIRFRYDSEQLDPVYTGFFNPVDSRGLVGIPKGPNVLGGFCIYRDFQAFYQNREKLVQEQSLPGFDKFETGLANLLPGKDFAIDVLSTLDNRLTVVAMQQSYDYLDGTPGIKLPGFAVIADLAKPQQGADLFRLLFQTIVGITNLQAGQQGREPMILSAEQHGDVQIQFGRLINKPSGNDLPVGLNFTPASALVGNRFIMSSSLEVCRNLVDYLQKSPEPVASGNINFDFELFPIAITEALESNRDILQARLIQQGRGPERAEQELSLAFELLRHIQSVRLSQTATGSHFDIKLEVSWQ